MAMKSSSQMMENLFVKWCLVVVGWRGMLWKLIWGGCGKEVGEVWRKTGSE